MKFTILAAVATLTAAFPASANTWESVVKNDTGEPIRISATSSNGLSAVLSCGSRGRVTAIMSTEEIDLNAALKTPALVSKNKTADVTIGDNEPYRAKLTHWSSRDLFFTRKYKGGAKIFNGLVRGELISVKLPGRDELTYDLPKADSTFGKFAEACKSIRES